MKRKKKKKKNSYFSVALCWPFLLLTSHEECSDIFQRSVYPMTLFGLFYDIIYHVRM